ncbi:MFS transporter [Liquorilactobacillus uvarum]|uniref:MFS transporter n=2 Tax=Bacillati TaxID=1783272 RepID=UPI00288952C6|nr:MFS transporter [Liquorilactobacillus uvarum]
MTLSSYLKKRFSYRFLFIASILIFSLGTLIGGLAPSFSTLLIGRVLQGIGSGVAIPLTFNLVIEYIPIERIGIWMGFASMIMSLAPSIGPTFGGLLVDTLGWRMIFFTILIIPVASFLIGFSSFAKDQKLKKQDNLDFLAFSLLSVALISLLIMISKFEANNFDLRLFFLFLLTMISFIWRSLTSKKVFLNIRVFSKLSFLMAILPFVTYQFSNIGANFIIPNYLQIGFGVTSLLAGFSLLPGTLISVILNPFFGKIYDSHGERSLLIFGNCLVLIAFIIMFFTTNTMGLFGITLLYIIFSLGRVMAFGILNTSALAHLGKEDKSDGTAIFQTAQQFAGAVGTAVVSLISASSSNIKDGMHNTILLFIILFVAVFGMLFSLFRTKEYKK